MTAKLTKEQILDIQEKARKQGVDFDDFRGQRPDTIQELCRLALKGLVADQLVSGFYDLRRDLLCKLTDASEELCTLDL